MKVFLVYGIIICSLFFIAGTRGFVLTSSMLQAANWGPLGHSQYHK